MSDKEATPDRSSAEKESSEPRNRRQVIGQAVAGFLSFILVAIPSTIGGIFFLDPILRGPKSKNRNSESGTLDGFIKLSVAATSIPDDGTPRSVTVVTDLDDAWNRFQDVPVGSVWLRKNPDGKIVVFNSVCPHLGCSVNYRRSDNDFFCPCHTSSFSLDGEKTNDVPPRSMDSLELVTATDGVPNESGQELWVKYQNFRRATAEKTPI